MTAVEVRQITLGQRLLELRRDAEATQAELAEWLGTKQSHVSAWETGLREPYLPTLRRYALVFRMTLAEILEGVI
jgi:transcriptional regulator with XRE-family HTH domain